MKSFTRFSFAAVALAIGLLAFASPSASGQPPAPEDNTFAVELLASADVATFAAPVSFVAPQALATPLVAVLLYCAVALAVGSFRPRIVGLVALNGVDNLLRAFGRYCGLQLGAVRLYTAEWTKIGDLWVPEVIAEGMREVPVDRGALIDSGVVVTSPLLVAAASGPGTEITLPFIVEPNHDDQQQLEDTAPEMRKLGSGLQRAAIFNRVSPLGATALSGVISGVKPGGDILQVLLASVVGLRKRQRAKLVYAALCGLFDIAATKDANSGAFKALRLDNFSETLNTTASNFIDDDMIQDALALAGENKVYFVGGVAIMHSVIETALVKQDQIDVIRNSAGDIILRTYKGMMVVVDDRCVRAGTTSGKVYSTFFCGRGAIAMGDKPQVVTDVAGEVAALQLDLRDLAKNNVAIYDRTRFICHPQGAKWNPGNGVPSEPEAGPSNTELADDANWALGTSDVKNVRIVCLRTNG